MNRLVRGSIMVVAAALAWACSTDLGKDADVTDHLTANPSVVQVSNTDSQTVDVEAINPQGQQLAAEFSFSNVSAGVVVRQDTSFLPVSGGHSQTRARFVVRGADSNTFVSGSFTVSANGKSVVVPVKIFPSLLTGVTLSNSTPAIGDTIQLTAPAGIRFTNATTITTPGDTSRRLANVGISADSTILFILPGPDIADQALTLGNVQVTFTPGVNFSGLTTNVSVTTGPLPSPLPTITVVSSSTPALLDTVSFTAPSPFGWTDSSRVTTAGGPNQFVDVSADHSTLRVVVGAGITGLTSISNASLGGQISLGRVTLLGAVALTSPPLPSPLPTVTVSNASPALGDTVTVTAPAGFGFQSTSRVTLGGGAPNIHVDVSTDGTTLRFIIGPNSSGTLSVSNAKLGGNPALNTVTLVSAVAVTSPSAPPLAAVYSNTSPAGGAQITATAPASYRLKQNVTIKVGGVLAIIDSVSADSLVAYFRPSPGSSGVPVFSNVLLANLLSFNLTNVNSTVSVTAGALVPIAGTLDPNTAPTVTTPATGATATFVDKGTWLGDCGGVPCQWYKLVITTPGDYTFDARWDNSSDLGTYIVESDQSTGVDQCDAAGNAFPPFETCSITLAAGTYYIQMQNFAPFYPDPDPTFIELRITAP